MSIWLCPRITHGSFMARMEQKQQRSRGMGKAMRTNEAVQSKSKRQKIPGFILEVRFISMNAQ